VLAAYDVSLDLIRELRPIVTTLRRHDRDLASQLQRAATSISLNIAEGRDRSGGDQRRFYEIAAGSAGEVRAALDTADAWGYPIAVASCGAVLHRVRGLLYGLTHGRRR
jgi:four helix bundle protein